MDKIKNILAPTDLSDLSVTGIRHALNLAKALGAEVTVYHVVGVEELMRQDHLRLLDNVVGRYEAALDRFLKNHCSDLLPLVAVHRKVELGAPAVNIVDEAEKEGVDLIVISTHGRTALSHIMMGSVAEKVVRRAPCPVLSIRPEPEDKLKTRAAA